MRHSDGPPGFGWPGGPGAERLGSRSAPGTNPHLAFRQANRGADVIRFPARRCRAVRLIAEHDAPGWLVVRGENGWAFASLADARDFAAELARQHGERLIDMGAGV